MARGQVLAAARGHCVVRVRAGSHAVGARPPASRASGADYRSPESLEHANRPLAPRTSARGLRCEGEGAASDVDHRYETEGAASGAGFSQTHDH